MNISDSYCGECNFGLQIQDAETYGEFCKRRCRYLQITGGCPAFSICMHNEYNKYYPDIRKVFEKLQSYELMFIEILAIIGAEGESYNGEYDRDKVAEIIIQGKEFDDLEREVAGGHHGS